MRLPLAFCDLHCDVAAWVAVVFVDCAWPGCHAHVAVDARVPSVQDRQVLVQCSTTVAGYPCTCNSTPTFCSNHMVLTHWHVCLGVGSQTSMEALYLMLFFVMLGMVVFGTVIFYCEAGTLDPQTGV